MAIERRFKVGDYVRIANGALPGAGLRAEVESRRVAPTTILYVCVVDDESSDWHRFGYCYAEEDLEPWDSPKLATFTFDPVSLKTAQPVVDLQGLVAKCWEAEPSVAPGWVQFVDEDNEDAGVALYNADGTLRALCPTEVFKMMLKANAPMT